MLNFVCQSMVNLARNGQNWPNGQLTVMSIRTISVGLFKFPVSSESSSADINQLNISTLFSLIHVNFFPLFKQLVTSSRPTTLWNHSKRSWIISFCHCSKRPTSRKSIPNYIVSCSMLLDSTALTTNRNQRIHCSIVMCRHRKSGQTKIIRHMHITFTTCMPIWLCWINSESEFFRKKIQTHVQWKVDTAMKLINFFIFFYRERGMNTFVLRPHCGKLIVINRNPFLWVKF